MIAFAVGTGVGINTVIAAKLGVGKKNEADEFAGVGTPLAIGIWLVFALVCWLIMPAYARMSTNSERIIQEVIVYGRIVCVFSMGLFLESIWTKVLQANGNMKTPMFAQILGAMQTCIVPVVSFNYAAGNADRCRKTLSAAIIFGWALMAVGTLCFELIPVQMLRVFTSDELVVEIGKVGFRFIGISFIPLVTSLIFPVFFQAVGSALKSSLLTIIRTVVLFVPLGFLFSRFGLNLFWLTFPVTELLTSLAGIIYYRQFLDHPYVKGVKVDETEKENAVIKPSHPGVIITIAREHGSSGKQIGKIVAEKLGIPFYYKEMTALAAQESGLDKELFQILIRTLQRCCMICI